MKNSKLNSRNKKSDFEKIIETELDKYKSTLQKENLEDKILGTKNYLSPEIILGNEELAEASDVWAIGVILFELITRKYPFKGQNEFELYDNIIDCNIDWNLYKSAKNYNKDLEEIIRLFLAKNSKERYNNFKTIKKHSFFSGINWKELTKLSTGLISYVKQKVEKTNASITSLKNADENVTTKSEIENVKKKKGIIRSSFFVMSRPEIINTLNNELIKQEMKKVQIEIVEEEATDSFLNLNI